MIFWMATVALIALALAIMLLPILRGTAAQPTGPAAQQQNIQIAREKKQQLDAQLADGEIDQAGL